MNAAAQDEVYDIVRELGSIIAEMEDISRSVRYDYVGIGNERCAKAITSIANDYRDVKYRLNGFLSN